MVYRASLQFLHSSFPWYEVEVVGHLCLKQDEKCLKRSNCVAPKRECVNVEVVGHLCLKQDEKCLKRSNCEAPKRECVNSQHHSSVAFPNYVLPAHVAEQLK